MARLLPVLAALLLAGCTTPLVDLPGPAGHDMPGVADGAVVMEDIEPTGYWGSLSAGSGMLVWRGYEPDSDAIAVYAYDLAAGTSLQAPTIPGTVNRASTSDSMDLRIVVNTAPWTHPFVEDWDAYTWTPGGDLEPLLQGYYVTSASTEALLVSPNATHWGPHLELMRDRQIIRIPDTDPQDASLEAYTHQFGPEGELYVLYAGPGREAPCAIHRFDGRLHEVLRQDDCHDFIVLGDTFLLQGNMTRIYDPETDGSTPLAKPPMTAGYVTSSVSSQWISYHVQRIEDMHRGEYNKTALYAMDIKTGERRILVDGDQATAQAHAVWENEVFAVVTSGGEKRLVRFDIGSIAS